MSKKFSLNSEIIRKVCKAKYWQQSYDEWKEQGAIFNNFRLSELITDDLLQGYMDNGWHEITRIYKKTILGNSSPASESKSDIINSFASYGFDQQELILEILGSIRKYMVKNIFNCVQENLSKYNEVISVGSSNITSDYDVSILGPTANDIMWRMFMTFLAKFEDDLPTAFDVNLYCSPLYLYQSRTNSPIICKQLLNLPERIDYSTRYFTLAPINTEDTDIELTWVFVKLLDLEIDIPEIFKPYVLQAIKYQSMMNYLLDELDTDPVYLNISLQNNLHPANSITKETRQIIKQYYLQYLWQKPIQKFIYSYNESTFIEKEIILNGDNLPQNNIFFYCNIPNYFSNDSYYTCSSVISTVIENQINYKLDFSNRCKKTENGIYLISAIENFADYISHIYKEYQKSKQYYSNFKDDIKLLIIKYSKYLYRTYDSLSKIGIKKYSDRAFKLLKYVLPFRKNYNLNQMNQDEAFIFLYYINEDIPQYIEKISSKILEDLAVIFKRCYLEHEN